MSEKTLTPRQRFRQFVPSWLVKGQTTSLLASETENELVSEDRGGMARRIYPRSGRQDRSQAAPAAATQTDHERRDAPSSS